MHVLVLTADPSLVSTLQDVSKEFGIEGQSTDSFRQASEQLALGKYEGLVLDFDTVPDARPLIAMVHASQFNKNAVVFAIATSICHTDQALTDGAHFLLRRPLAHNTIRKTIRKAYDLLSGKHRLDFRCTASLPVRLTAPSSGVSVDCWTMNVSSNGLGVATPAPLKIAEALEIAFTLPDGFTIRATAIVIWDDRHGKSGLNFQCGDIEMRHKLDAWLDSQFAVAHAKKAAG
jgi:DNA-binding response OmpR family regulator